MSPALSSNNDSRTKALKIFASSSSCNFECNFEPYACFSKRHVVLSSCSIKAWDSSQVLLLARIEFTQHQRNEDTAAYKMTRYKKKKPPGSFFSFLYTWKKAHYSWKSLFCLRYVSRLQFKVATHFQA